MGRIQSNIGLTTGVDIQKTVDQLMAISAQPRDRLQNRVKGFQSQQVAVTELTALTIGIQLQTDRLGKVANLQGRTVASSKADVLTVTSSGNPAPGNYAVQVVQTAQTATASSTAFTSASDTLAAGEFVVRTGGFVDDSIDLDDLNGGAGIARGKIQITDRAGTSREIDLRFASTMEDVVKSINTTSGLKVNAKVNGDRIVLSDLSGQTTSNLIVGEVGDGSTAATLGLGGVNVAGNSATGEDIAFLGNGTRLSALRDGRGIAFQSGDDLSVTLADGSTRNIDLNATRTPSTIGQLVTAINAADPTKLEARVNSAGDGIELIDKTTGSGTLVASGKLADQLGFTGKTAIAGKINGDRVQSSLSGPLLSSLKGGKGIGPAGSINITNRAGNTTTVNLSGSVGLQDVIDKINASGAGVTASLNKSRTGLVLQDVTGATSSNLVIADADSNSTATKLNLTADVAKSSVDSSSLGLQYISETTGLSQLNQGRGVRLGSFTIKNSAGETTGVNLTTAQAKTVGDVIKAINTNSLGITARLNDEGDGILISDSSSGSETLTITDSQNGNAALDLGIRGNGKQISGSPPSQQINGSQTFRLTLTGTEKLSEVVTRLNNANGPLTASLLTSSSTVRVLFTSRASGQIGRVVAEGETVGLTVNSTGTGRDALVSIGATDELGGTLVRSSDNKIDNAIDGLSLTVKGRQADPVEVTVSNDNGAIERNLQLFVDQFNKVRDKIIKETAYNADTKVSGVLFGSTETLRVEQSLNRLVTQRSFSSGKVQSLEQLGISLDDKGKLKLDKDKLNKTLASNYSDVEAFLTKEKVGFSARAKTTLDELVSAKSSVLVNRGKALQAQIDTANSRVAGLNTKLDRERERLLKQFYDMESTIARIRNNGSGLNQLQTISA